MTGIMELPRTQEVAFELNKSYESRERSGYTSPLTDLLFDEVWDDLHDDPRFKELLDKIGFTKVMPPRKK